MGEGDDEVWTRLYPEFGSLAGYFDALQRACADVGTAVTLTDASSGVICAATLTFARGGPRTVRVSINRNRHGFVLAGSHGEAEAVRGQLDGIHDVARAVSSWLRDQQSAIEMNTTPRLAVTKTEARRVFGNTVELYWWLPLQPFSWASDAHREMLELARDVPELRQLAPFSACTTCSSASALRLPGRCVPLGSGSSVLTSVPPNMRCAWGNDTSITTNPPCSASAARTQRSRWYWSTCPPTYTRPSWATDTTSTQKFLDRYRHPDPRTCSRARARRSTPRRRRPAGWSPGRSRDGPPRARALVCSDLRQRTGMGSAVGVGRAVGVRSVDGVDDGHAASRGDVVSRGIVGEVHWWPAHSCSSTTVTVMPRCSTRTR